MFGKMLGRKSLLQRRKTAVANRSGLLRGLRLEPLEARQLLSVSIPLYNGDFESPTVWVLSNGGGVTQQTVAPGTQPWNTNLLDPRFGTPGLAKTAQGGAGPGENGEGIYSEQNDIGVPISYFNYVDGQLPSPASGTNFLISDAGPRRRPITSGLTSSQTLEVKVRCQP